MNHQPLTIGAALAYARGQLKASDSPVLDARLLLERVLNVNHAYLIAHTDKPLADEAETTFRRLVRRAALREPIPYLTGRAPFFGRQFIVSRAVLIPRPETELLVEQALSWLNRRSDNGQTSPHNRPHVVDIGTGSGCIAITMALETANATIEAVDISPEALEIAQRNASLLGAAGRLRFHQGSLLSPIAVRTDLILANLPYIADPEWTALDDGIKWYEPDIALRGGPDGLDVIRQLLSEAKNKLAPGGAIMLEIGWQQGATARALARTLFPESRIDILMDYGGRDRLMTIQMTG